jgi:hypothetical protein
MNVAARVAISETQDMWVMSNWYGMDKFPVVSEFHEGRFADAATTPVFFGGDFNAIPHTDGGDSPASRVLLQAGFTDAYRSLHPDVETFPGFSHRSGRRIDQLYFKGAGLRHTSTRLINTWPTGPGGERRTRGPQRFADQRFPTPNSVPRAPSAGDRRWRSPACRLRPRLRKFEAHEIACAGRLKG